MTIIETIVRNPDNEVRYLYELEIQFVPTVSTSKFQHRWNLISHCAEEEVLATSHKGMHLNTALGLHLNKLSRIAKEYNLKFLAEKETYSRKVVKAVFQDKGIQETVERYYIFSKSTRETENYTNYILKHLIHPDDKSSNQEESRFRRDTHLRLRGIREESGKSKHTWT